MLNQKLQQKLLQKLSPQQILLMKLLQIPTVGLEQRIKQEIEDNPALEMEEPDNADSLDKADEVKNDEIEDEFSDNTEEVEDYAKEDDYDLEDYMNTTDDDDIPDYRLKANNYSKDDEPHEIPFASGISFHDYLISQLGLRNLDKKKHNIGLYIIGNLDYSGYLQRSTDAIVDDLAFTQNLSTTSEEVEEVLKIIQDFDPLGVGARNLKECLLIQLKKKMEDSPSAEVELAIRIMSRYFNEFTKKHYDKIIKRAEITENDLKKAIDEILKLNPKPGNSLSETTKTNHYIIPDFTVTNNNGELELTLNSWNMPDLHISRTYGEMLSDLSKGKKSKKQKEAFSFIKRKVDSARWFIEAIRQRQNTLLNTMEAIVDYQKEYFLTGDETKLRPMILKDIAEKIDMDISTVSRVANSKYVQTDFGTFLLKNFFSESMIKENGEEVSTREIKKILSNIIEAEDKKKPLTDDRLAQMLKEKGYNVARRTIAKYREQLSIPVARLRKEL
ncbi:MAG: RNA polymerase sigma-54 factor [Bacteroidetes bacterium]|nr:MAG: RNA polymerase sigma-54 factor [Bacteroidota bacterium]